MWKRNPENESEQKTRFSRYFSKYFSQGQGQGVCQGFGRFFDWEKAFFLFWAVAGSLTILFYAVWLGVIGRENPEYLKDFHAAVNPDAVTYVQLGKNIWSEGVYSRSVGEPYVPDFKWTPVFPFLAGLANLLGGVSGIVFLNIGFTLFSALLLARIAFFWTHSRLISCLLFAFLFLDPLVWSMTLQAMSDVVFLFFLLLGVYWAFPVLFSDPGLNGVGRLGILRVFCGGLAFSLAILARPSGLYVPVALTFAFLGAPLVDRILARSQIGKGQESGRLLSTKRTACRFLRLWVLAVFLAGAYVPTTCWALRNAEVFGKLALCGNQNIVMVYYSGGGAWQTALNCSLEEAQERISHEFELPANVKCQNPEAFGLDQGEVDGQLAKCKRAVLLRYPSALAFSSIVGVGKSFLAHETRTLLRIAGEEKAYEEAFPVWRSWIFFWSIFFQGTILLLAFATILANWRTLRTFWEWNPALSLALVGWCAYFLLTMALSGIDCCARYRLPMTPVLYWLAATSLERRIKKSSD